MKYLNKRFTVGVSNPRYAEINWRRSAPLCVWCATSCERAALWVVTIQGGAKIFLCAQHTRPLRGDIKLTRIERVKPGAADSPLGGGAGVGGAAAVGGREWEARAVATIRSMLAGLKAGWMTLEIMESMLTALVEQRKIDAACIQQTAERIKKIEELE